jgi:hypothetical protein
MKLMRINDNAADKITTEKATLLKISRLCFMFMMAINANACKFSSAPTSKTKFDDNVNKIMELSKLSTEQLKSICSKNTLIVFVGNAERPFSEKNQTVQFAAATGGKDNLESIVKNMAEQVRGSMRNNEDCKKFSSEFSVSKAADQGAQKKIPQSLVVTIIDGPGPMDSQIVSFWLSWDPYAKWGVTNFQDKVQTKIDSKGNNSIEVNLKPTFWSLSEIDRTLKKSESPVGFEIHLPTELGNVVAFFKNQKPPKPFTSKEWERPAMWQARATPPVDDTFNFDQSLYIFKSHGGRILPANHKPQVSDLAMTVKEQEETKQSSSHMFLFDPNAPLGKVLSANVFSPYWFPLNGCKQLAEKQDLAAKFAERVDLCKRCLPLLAKEKVNLGSFSGCPGQPSPVATLSQNQTGKLDTNQGGSLDTNQGGSLDTNQGGSLDTNQGGSLDTNQGGSLDTNQGGSLDTNQGGSLAVGSQETLSAGKSFSYQSKPDNADGFLLVAAGVTTDPNLHIDGLTPLKLFSPDQSKLPLDKRSPTLIVLDSCYGNAAISESVRNLIANASTPVVVMSNPNAMYENAINYKAINYSKYVALGNIFYWDALIDKGMSLPDATVVKGLSSGLKSYLDQSGLVPVNTANKEVPQSQRTFKISVIVP